jgi:hypothetical protein
MKKLISSVVIVAALSAPLTAQAAPRETESNPENALILLGLIGLVVLAPQLGIGASRDNHDLSISPLDVDTDVGVEFVIE